MIKSRLLSSDKGSILIVSMWILVILSMLTIGIGYRLSTELRLYGYQIDRVRLEGMTSSGIKIAEQKLKEDVNEYDALNEEWARGMAMVLEQGTQQDYGTDQSENKEDLIRIQLTDEESKINVNTAPFDFIARIPGISANTINDIRERRIENAYKKSSFEFPEELLCVKGIDEATLQKLDPFITVYGSGKVNINTASKDVLRSLGLNAHLIDVILLYRNGIDELAGTDDDGVFDEVSTIRENILKKYAVSDDIMAELDELAAENLITTKSSQFRVSIESKLKNGSQCRVFAIMDRTLLRIRCWTEI